MKTNFSKNKFFKRTLSLVIVALIASTVPTFAGNDATDAKVQSYEEQLQKLQNDKNNALQELNRLQREEASYWVQMGQLDEIVSYNTKMKKLAQDQLDEITVQISEKKTEIAEKEIALEAQEKAFMDRMVQSYMNEDADLLELILGSESLLDFLTRFDRVNTILENDKSIIKTLSETKETLEVAKFKLDEAEERQKTHIAEYEATILENERLSEIKLNEIKALENNQAAWQKNYEYNRQQEEKLNKELEEYLAELARKSQASYVGGVLGFPLELGTQYFVSSEFGWRKLGGVDDYHLGIDLAAAYRTPVLAANSGKVVTSASHWSYGNYILIDHGGGIATLYAHLDERLVNVGDEVQAGQKIGYIGLTGNTTGYHLHFETRKDGKVQNPRDYVNFP